MKSDRKQANASLKEMSDSALLALEEKRANFRILGTNELQMICPFGGWGRVGDFDTDNEISMLYCIPDDPHIMQTEHYKHYTLA